MKYFLDTCLGTVPKTKSLEPSNPEIWNYLNYGGFTLQMGAHNTFKRTSMNQMIFFFDDIQIHGVTHTTADFF